MLPLYDALLVTHNSRIYPSKLSYYTTVQQYYTTVQQYYCCDNCFDGRRKSSAQANTADGERLTTINTTNYCVVDDTSNFLLFCSGHVVPFFSFWHILLLM